MGGLNIAFNTIQSALEADQDAINTTANNVANANTPGYTEETVTWQETAPISVDGQQFGTGVAITSVNSQQSLVLNQAIDQQQQALSAATSRESGLTDVEDIFNQVATDSSASGSGGIGGGSDKLLQRTLHAGVQSRRERLSYRRPERRAGVGYQL
jgi:flagellar hook-associated protein 1 FlgK